MSVKGDSDDSNASVEAQFSRASSTVGDVSLDNAADGDDGSGTAVSACEVTARHIDSVDDDRVNSESAAGKPVMSDDVLPVADRCRRQSPAAGVGDVSCASVNLPLVEDGLSSGHVTDTEADDVDRSSEAVCSSQQLSVDMSHLVNTRHCDTSDDDNRAVTCADSRLQQVPVCITRSDVICCLSVSGTISVKFSLDVKGQPRY